MYTAGTKQLTYLQGNIFSCIEIHIGVKIKIQYVHKEQRNKCCSETQQLYV